MIAHSLRHCIFRFALVLGLWHSPCSAADFLLYDATAGTLPGSQDWLFYAADAGGGSVSQTLVGGGTRLASDDPARGGWSNTFPVLNTFKNPAFPSLVASEGFAIDWSMQIISESHVSTNRAGTSMILLGSDNMGIELGFWSNEIWAQTAVPLFTKGESVSFDTTASTVSYRLLIKDDDYILYANDTAILNGQTRSYAAFGSAPYTLSNYFFIGDNTTSAGATTDLGSIRLVTNVPEPKSTGLAAAMAISTLWLHKRRQGLKLGKNATS